MMEIKTFNFGEKSEDYPYGYGYCQCGCSKVAPRLSKGMYLHFISTHHPLKIAQIEKEKSDKLKQRWLVAHKKINDEGIKKEIPIIPNSDRKWSKEFDKCKGCGSKEKPHWAFGYCSRCYPKFIVRKTGEFDRKNKEYYATYKKKVKAKISDTMFLRKKSKIPISQILIPDLLQLLYIKKKKSLEDIAKIYGCSRVYIYNLCNKYNIKVRDKSKAREVAQLGDKLPERLYHKVNDKFFSQWNNGMAYVLGFIYADGYLGHQLNFISISQKEPEILEKIKKLMQSEQTLKYYKHQDIYHLVIGKKRIIKDLIKLGLTPKKSLTIKFPNIPDQYVNHFIRGYFDGDGSICRQGGSWRASIVSGSKNFIESIKENFEKFAGVSEAKLHKHKDANAYILGYNSRDNITKIFNFFYDEHTLKNELYLTRKYKLFVEATQKSYRGKPIVLINLEENVFGEWVKQHLKHYNFGAYETMDLARFLGINPRTIQRWMKGIGKPEEWQLQCIKDYLLKKDTEINKNE